MRGKEFEEAFKLSAKDYVLYRLKDAPKDFNNPKLKFSSSNIADFILGNPLQKTMHFVELKETKQASLSFNNINWTHAESMEKMNVKGFCESYHFVRFKEKRKGTFAAKTTDLINFRIEQISKNGSKSIPYTWFLENAINVPEKIVRTKYRLDLASVFGKGDDF